MNLHDCRLLLDFHYWARDRMLAAVAPLAPEQYTRSLGGSFASVRDTVMHIYFSESLWYLRWTGNSPTTRPSLDLFPDVAALRAAWRDSEAKVRAFIDAAGDEGLTRVISYKLLNGDPGASALWQMLQHIVNHGSYHRGQVTAMLRQLGAAPPKSMDLITFYRERGS